MIRQDDKRLINERENGVSTVKRINERDPHYCKYCYKDQPTFVLYEKIQKKDGSIVTQVLRCCWKCGSGLEEL